MSDLLKEGKVPFNVLLDSGHPVNMCFIKCGAQTWEPFKRGRNSCTFLWRGTTFRTASLVLLSYVALMCGTPP